ncbi:MAG TPA: MSMEG_4193 family putative phosphomutase [Acidimicrobiales bacterium]|nr:MSMEG_4193 family putative phosphomutase [Acidimicrobiales bacterium]
MPGAKTAAERSRETTPRRRRGTRRRPPPPTVVLLVRHGTTETTGKELPGRASGLHLAESGREQAEAVAQRIAALIETSADGRKAPRGRIAAVYSSPLERTRETAAPIAKAAGCEVTIDDALVELDIGEWTGLALEAAYKRPEWATIQRYPSGFTFPGGESFVDMQARMVACLDRLRAAHAGETIVAVSHADPIRAVVAHAMGTHLDLFQRLAISPCSVTAIAYGDGGPLVLTVNATGDGRALVPS